MVLEAAFGFLLGYHPTISVIIYSALILILINIFYKVLIKQGEAKQLKQKAKELNKQMRAEQKAGNKEKASQLMSEMMQANSKTMRMTMKPMIISFIIVIIFLPVMTTFYGDTSTQLQNSTGTLNIGGIEYAVQGTESGLVIANASCTPVCITNIEGKTFEVSMSNSNVHFARVVTLLPVSLPLVGTTLGWLGWYIIVSIPLAIVIRKILKIYV